MKKIFLVILILCLTASSAFAEINVYSLSKKERNLLISNIYEANYKTSMDASGQHIGNCTRKNPLAEGQYVEMKITEGDKECNLKLKLADVIRGKAAEDFVVNANSTWNSAPDKGKEYVVAKFELSLYSRHEEYVFTFSEYEFDTVSNGVVTSNTEFYAGIDTSLKLLSGGSGYLYVVSKVNEGDAAPMLLYCESIWISLIDHNQQ